MRRNGSRRSARSAAEQAFKAVAYRAAGAALPGLLAAGCGLLAGLLVALALRLADTKPALDRAADALAGLGFRELRRRRRVVDLVLERIERSDQVHRHREARELLEVGAALSLRARHHGRVGHVVDLGIADVDVALARDAEERRLDVEILVVRDTVLDDEARGHLGEVGLLRLARLRLLVR